MEETAFIAQLVEQKSNYDIDIYRDINFRENHIPFDGTPKKHPHDMNYLILLSDPFSKNNSFYEFSLNSIGIIEDMGTIISEDGRSANKIRIWVKKGMTALKSEPFMVS